MAWETWVQSQVDMLHFKTFLTTTDIDEPSMHLHTLHECFQMHLLQFHPFEILTVSNDEHVAFKIFFKISTLDNSLGKRDDACVKKKATSRQGEQALSLLDSVRRSDNTIAVWCLGATHTSLDEALVSPFHSVASLSRLTVCRNIKDYEMELQTKTTGLWQTSKRN